LLFEPAQNVMQREALEQSAAACEVWLRDWVSGLN
jgi:hypothetical protein